MLCLAQQTIQVEQGARSRAGVWVVVVVFLVAFVVVLHADAQQGPCGDGIIKLPLQFKGTIEVCLPLAAQAPALQSQLTDIAKAEGDQQGQVRELKRLIRNLNTVSQNIGQKRQAELLKNLSAQLSADQAAGQEQMQQEIADLADRLDSIKDLMIEKLGNKETAVRTTAAVDGPVGDAIAQLDLTKAQNLLEDIRVQLKAIGSEVGAVHGDTKDIKKDVTEIRKSMEEQKADEAQRTKEEENDPALFARVTMYGNKTPNVYGGEWRLMMYIAPPPPLYRPFSDPTLRVVFRSGAQKAWVTDVTERTGGAMGDYWQLTTDEVGDTAVLCLVVRDPKTGMRRQWTQRYTVHHEVRDGGWGGASFAPTGEPTLTPADDAPCDGVTEVRQPATDTLRESTNSSSNDPEVKLASLMANVTYQPSGFPSSQLMIQITPNAGDSTYTARTIGNIMVAFANGTAVIRGHAQTFTFDSITPGRNMVVLGSSYLSVTGASLLLALDPTSTSPNVSGGSGSVSGTLSLTTTPYAGWGPNGKSPHSSTAGKGDTNVATSGQLIGSYTATLVPKGSPATSPATVAPEVSPGTTAATMASGLPNPYDRSRANRPTDGGTNELCPSGCNAKIGDFKVVARYQYPHPTWGTLGCEEKVFRLPQTWPGGPYLHSVVCKGPNAHGIPITLVNFRLAATDRMKDQDVVILFVDANGEGAFMGPDRRAWRVKIYGTADVESMTIDMARK